MNYVSLVKIIVERFATHWVCIDCVKMSDLLESVSNINQNIKRYRLYEKKV